MARGVGFGLFRWVPAASGGALADGSPERIMRWARSGLGRAVRCASAVAERATWVGKRASDSLACLLILSSCLGPGTRSTPPRCATGGS